MSLLIHPTARDSFPPNRNPVGNSPVRRRRQIVVRDRLVASTTSFMRIT